MRGEGLEGGNRFVADWWSELVQVAVEVAVAVTPLAAVAVVSNFLFLKLPRTQVRTVITGLVLTALGTIFFLYGVRIGFMPAGQTIGQLIAASRPAGMKPMRTP